MHAKLAYMLTGNTQMPSSEMYRCKLYVTATWTHRFWQLQCKSLEMWTCILNYTWTYDMQTFIHSCYGIYEPETHYMHDSLTCLIHYMIICRQLSVSSSEMYTWNYISLANWTYPIAGISFSINEHSCNKTQEYTHADHYVTTKISHVDSYGYAEEH